MNKRSLIYQQLERLAKLVKLEKLATLILLSPLLLLTSCERRELEVLVDESVNVRIVVNWTINFSEIYSVEPSGMTVMLWGNRGSRIVETSNDNRVSLRLEPDTYRLIIYNQTESEYAPYLRFYDTYSFENAVARSTTYNSATREADGRFIHYPDPIAVAVDTFLITEEMVAQDTVIFMPYKEYLAGNTARYYESERLYEIPEVPTPMTVTLSLKAKVKHRQSIKRIEASISGMADGFYLSRINRTTETGTLTFDPDTWTIEPYGTEADSMGIITNQTPSFGLPYGKELIAERDSADNMLNFRITLTNDSVQECRFKVGKDIRYLTPEGREAQIRYRKDLHNLRLELDLSEVIVMPITPDTRGAGFDARVDDWEDGGTFDMGGF